MGPPFKLFRSESRKHRAARSLVEDLLSKESVQVLRSLQSSGVLRAGPAAYGTGVYIHFPATMGQRNFPNHPQVQFYTTCPRGQYSVKPGGTFEFIFVERETDLPIQNMQFRNVP